MLSRSGTSLPIEVGRKQLLLEESICCCLVEFGSDSDRKDSTVSFSGLSPSSARFVKNGVTAVALNFGLGVVLTTVQLLNSLQSPVRSFESTHGDSENIFAIVLNFLVFAELERRLDVLTFRACFTRSIYEPRRLVVRGNVLLDGKLSRTLVALNSLFYIYMKHYGVNTRLVPGDQTTPGGLAVTAPPGLTPFNIPSYAAAYSHIWKSRSRRAAPPDGATSVLGNTNAVQYMAMRAAVVTC
ncbi:hypothetical protein B0H16DRAFT_1736346 [Mycena metata]|uniref:Uncharacterized protein n=1 Tax=Mycena metata TaxID=1033252 RepID=A0AAD7HNY8_9AGAR|nr:hypothetical protein B0H16DRAFT_1736346 [Mycena metata]